MYRTHNGQRMLYKATYHWITVQHVGMNGWRQFSTFLLCINNTQVIQSQHIAECQAYDYSYNEGISCPYTENTPGGITTVIECAYRLKTRLKTQISIYQSQHIAQQIFNAKPTWPGITSLTVWHCLAYTVLLQNCSLTSPTHHKWRNKDK